MKTTVGTISRLLQTAFPNKPILQFCVSQKARTMFSRILTQWNSLLLVLALSSHGWLAAQQTLPSSNEDGTQSKCRIGILDTRAVAIAYYRSPQFREVMTKLRAEQTEAKKKGDLATVERLEKRGVEWNTKTHQQGFGTAPIREILDEKSQELEALATKANVVFVISKWEIAYQDKNANSGVEFVDLTDELVKTFQPDEATLKIIEQIKQKKPTEDRAEEDEK